MKSLKDYSLNLKEQDYHDYPAWSYSIIAKYARDGFGSLPTLHDKTKVTPAMEFGSLFDSILTRGKDTLNDYVVSDASVPEAERNALEYIASCTEAPTFDSLDKEYIYNRATEAGYQKNWGADAKYKHLAPYKSYYNALKSEKKLVSREDWDDAVDMARAFRSDEYLSKIFGTTNTNDIEYIYQAQFLVPWYIDGKDINIKIMPDLLIVNHAEKTVQPVDLKSSSAPAALGFTESFLKFRYDIQAELYTDVLEKVICGDPDYCEYTILPYLFTDISRVDKVPVSFVYDPKPGLSFTKNDRTYTYRGWQDILTEILNYEEQHAKVPSYITLDGPNDLRELLSR